VSRPVLCAIAAGVFLFIGVAGVIEAKSVESLCIAVNASGQRVVIGTELNQDGRDYKRDHPADDNNAILAALADAGPEAAWTSESITRCRTRVAFSRAVWIVGFALAAVFGLATLVTGPRSGTPASPKPGTVFLSYSHEDAAVAARLRAALEGHSIRVLIDSDSMSPGERIRDFIERCLRDSETVISIISTNSLQSAWVALEIVQTLQRNRWLQDRKFIACYLDAFFFDPECRLDLTRRIDDRLRRIEDLLPDYVSRRLDTRDLDEEKSRLYDLRNNLGLVLDTLKATLCLDLREPQFDNTIHRLTSTIVGRAGRRRTV
jgi:TIR domain